MLDVQVFSCQLLWLTILIINDTGQPDELACMMSKNASFLIKSYRPAVGFVYYPTMHPYEITEFPLDLFQQGSVFICYRKIVDENTIGTYNKVPILAGTNADEGSAGTYGLGNITVTQYTSILTNLFNATLEPLVMQVNKKDKREK